MYQKFALVRDSYQRIATELAPGIQAGIRILAETDERRMRDGEYAFVVLTIQTPLGPFSNRFIRIMKSRTNGHFFVRWKQAPTGRRRNDSGREEYLDIFGPLDQPTRKRVNQALLAFYLQVREESSPGPLHPELVDLKNFLKGETEQDENPPPVPQEVLTTQLPPRIPHEEVSQEEGEGLADLELAVEAAGPVSS